MGPCLISFLLWGLFHTSAGICCRWRFWENQPDWLARWRRQGLLTPLKLWTAPQCWGWWVVKWWVVGGCHLFMWSEVTFVGNLLQRKIAPAAITRIVRVQNILPVLEDPGRWGQPWRLVLSQKEENLLILEKAPIAKLNFLSVKFYHEFILLLVALQGVLIAVARSEKVLLNTPFLSIRVNLDQFDRKIKFAVTVDRTEPCKTFALYFMLKLIHLVCVVWSLKLYSALVKGKNVLRLTVQYWLNGSLRIKATTNSWSSFTHWHEACYATTSHNWASPITHTLLHVEWHGQYIVMDQQCNGGLGNMKTGTKYHGHIPSITPKWIWKLHP